MPVTDDTDRFERDLARRRRLRLGLFSVVAGLALLAGGGATAFVLWDEDAADKASGAALGLAGFGLMLLVSGIAVLLRGEKAASTPRYRANEL